MSLRIWRTWGRFSQGHGDVRAVDLAEGLMKRCEIRSDLWGVIADELADVLVEGATLAGTWAEDPGRLAGRAPVPEPCQPERPTLSAAEERVT
jgi:hypothetical protein